MALMNRDPFARTELHRNVYARPNAECSWCGTKDRRLYEYRTETDGGWSHEHKGLFCSKSCHDSYHGG